MLRDPSTNLITAEPAQLSALLERLESTALSPDHDIDNSVPFPWATNVLPLPTAEAHLVIDKLSPTIFLEALRRTLSHKDPCHDGVPGLLLKHMPYTFLAALYNLFKAMVITGITPHTRLQSYATLAKTLQKGDPLDLANYRV
jgi:hypothetical protein